MSGFEVRRDAMGQPEPWEVVEVMGAEKGPYRLEADAERAREELANLAAVPGTDAVNRLLSVLEMYVGTQQNLASSFPSFEFPQLSSAFQLRFVAGAALAHSVSFSHELKTRVEFRAQARVDALLMALAWIIVGSPIP